MGVEVPALRLAPAGQGLAPRNAALTERFGPEQRRLPQVALQGQVCQSAREQRQQRQQQGSVGKPLWNISTRVPETLGVVRVVTNVPGEEFMFRRLERIESQPRPPSKDAKRPPPRRPKRPARAEVVSLEAPQPPQLHRKGITFASVLWPGRLVTCSEDGTAALLGIDQDHNAEIQRLAVFAGHTGAVRHACAYEGHTLLTASDDATLRMWSVAEPAVCKVFKGHRGPVLAVLALPKASEVVSSSRDGSVRVWDANSRVCKQRLGDAFRPVTRLVSLPSMPEALFAMAASGLLQRWDKAGQAAVLNVLDEEGAVFSCMDVNEATATLCIGCRDGRMLYLSLDGAGVDDGKSPAVIKAFELGAAINVVRMYQDTQCSLAVAGLANGALVVLELASGAQVARSSNAHGTWVMDAQLLRLQHTAVAGRIAGPAGPALGDVILASCAFDGSVRVCRLSDPDTALFSSKQHASTAFGLCLAPATRAAGHRGALVKLYSAGADARVALALLRFG